MVNFSINNARETLYITASRLLDFLLPLRCAICDCELANAPALCGYCWTQLDFITGTICYRTGIPLPFKIGEQTLSLNAIKNPPIYERARSALHYSGATRQLIHKFKFHHRLELVKLMIPWLITTGQEYFREADFIIAVPLYKSRLLQRRFNQSAELARGLSKKTNIPIKIEWLRRTRKTLPQTGLSRHARQKNLRTAFSIHKKHYHALKNKHIILIDDVMTTGATAEACTKTLLRAGVAKVDILTVARVITPASIKI